MAGLCPVITCHYVKNIDHSTNYFISEIRDPDIERVLEPNLLLSALGQAFFSLSLGTSVMVIYGSYISKKENMVTIGAQVTLIDVSIAFLAGLLIIPAMYVAQAQGVQIFAEDGSLIEGASLVFKVLPTLFDSMGGVGLFVGFAFFVLMSVAALTLFCATLSVQPPKRCPQWAHFEGSGARLHNQLRNDHPGAEHVAFVFCSSVVPNFTRV